ncbi:MULTISPECIES: helix-turn-helix domain-containing protein [unclassified Streptomyces]|uniref:helix-turn-helix domain-containing protein n=1 Tax=unclassified Streptomyces TaxID=2593676 RepID=UPI0036679A98
MPQTPDVAQRRALVAQLSRGGESVRKIADRLGVSKDTVQRDRAALAATPAATRVAQWRIDADQTTATLQQITELATATADAKPAYLPTLDDDTAAQWHAQLRDAAATLLAVADTFRDYYPHLTDPTATPDP